MSSKLVVINVLAPSYYDDCHIPGSINIPHDKLAESLPSLDKNNRYVVYCAVITCPLSRQCAQLLIDAQFPHVQAYEGGIVEWYQKGYPCDGPAQLDYLHETIATNFVPEVEVPTISAEELLKLLQ